MDNPLALVCKGKVFHTKIFHILFKLKNLSSTCRLFDERFDIDEASTIRCGDVVVDGDEGAIGPPNTSASKAKTFKGLGGSNFVNKMAIHVDKGG